MKARIWMTLTLLCVMLAAAPVFAAEKKEEKPPKDLPDLTESSKLPAKMPKTVSGVVTLGDKGLAGVRITDGVDFVTTDKDGKYSITLKPAPMIPYLPSRTISVCWPSGTWPVRAKPGGRWLWWARLKDIEDPANVDFKLVKREQTLPVVVSFGTDPHDNFTRAHNYIWLDETARAGDHVTFAVAGGDLGYLGFGNADQCYTSIAKFTYDFPVLMPHCIGNHDVVGVHSKWWSVPHELAGNGAFIKYVGPIRWSFDVAGIRFVGMDWGLIDEHGKIQCGISNSAIDWLERDLKSLPKGTPAYFFNHQGWTPHQRFYEVCQKYNVKLLLGGHSHRNMFLGKPGGAEYWTKMSLYTLVYVQKDGFAFVDRCIYKGGRTNWDKHWRHNHRGCALYNQWPQANAKTFKGEHNGVKDVTLDSKAQTLAPVKAATYDVRIGARPAGNKPAKRWGLRITGADGNVQTFVYDDANDMLDLMGRKTYFNPVIPRRKVVDGKVTAASEPGTETWTEMRIFVTPDQVRVLVNSRVHYQAWIKAGAATRIEFFAEDGAAEFGRVDVWSHEYKDYKLRACANSG